MAKTKSKPATQKWVKGQMAKEQELKWVTVTQVGTGSMDSTGGVQHITNVAEGTTINGRIGHEIMVQSVRLQGNCISNHSTAVNNLTAICRIALIRDNRDDADSPPTIATIFGSVCNFYRNHPKLPDAEISRHYTILWDKAFVLSPKEGGMNGRQLSYFSRRKHRVYWNGSAVTDTQKGSLYVLTASNLPSAADEPVQQMRSIVRFTDS